MRYPAMVAHHAHSGFVVSARRLSHCFQVLWGVGSVFGPFCTDASIGFVAVTEQVEQSSNRVIEGCGKPWIVLQQMSRQAYG